MGGVTAAWLVSFHTVYLNYGIMFVTLSKRSFNLFSVLNFFFVTSWEQVFYHDAMIINDFKSPVWKSHFCHAHYRQKELEISGYIKSYSVPLEAVCPLICLCRRL